MFSFDIVILVMIFLFSLPAFWLGYIFVDEKRFRQFVDVLSKINNIPAPITKETVSKVQILGKCFISIGFIIVCFAIVTLFMQL